MIKKLLATAAAIAGVGGIASNAHAEAYIAGGVNQTTTQQHSLQFDPSMGYDLELGTAGPLFRGEVGYHHLEGQALGGVVSGKVDDFDATLYADLHAGGLTLSVGAGPDYVQGEATSGGAQVAALNGGWAYHVAGQVSVDLSDRIKLALTYRDIPNDHIESVGVGVRVKI